ncbi:MAG: phospho-N-acetylmuramoyl-pentapeptide-transferase [Erysipelotrichales bacterium]
MLDVILNKDNLEFLIGGLIAFLLCAIIMPFVIPQLHKFKFGQSIREDGPKSHLAKQGTPTMGGVVFVIVAIITMFVYKPSYALSGDGLAITAVFFCFFLIGFVDDALIIIRKKNDGLSPKLKLLLQILVTLSLIVIYPDLFFSPEYTTVSFLGFGVNLHLFYILFALIMFVGYSNATNLTDGLDGLSSITVAIALFFMCVIAMAQQQSTVAMYCAILIGALLGFYLYNKRPAKIFMGDTGSLALGGFYAIVALLLKVEILSLIIGLLFVIETISVVMQVLYYKKTKKRIFRMAPIHHHFEAGPLKEAGTVRLFYVLSLIFGLIGMVIYFV